MVPADAPLRLEARFKQTQKVKEAIDAMQELV